MAASGFCFLQFKQAKRAKDPTLGALLTTSGALAFSY
jgi:hypothetical protein